MTEETGMLGTGQTRSERIDLGGDRPDVIPSDWNLRPSERINDLVR
jgi:hypothetical protein